MDFADFGANLMLSSREIELKTVKGLKNGICAHYRRAQVRVLVSMESALRQALKVRFSVSSRYFIPTERKPFFLSPHIIMDVRDFMYLPSGWRQLLLLFLTRFVTWTMCAA